MADIKERLAESKLKEAEAKIATQKIRRDAAYASLVRAQKRGGSPDIRARLTALYDRAEERLEEAENEAREARRRKIGLSPTVSQSGSDAIRARGGSHILRWLSSHVNAYNSPQALAVGAAEEFDIAVDSDLRSAAAEAWRS